MKLKRNIFFLSLLCGLLFIALAIPLLNEMIAPNDYVGIRIPKTEASEVEWYRINKIGAWALVGAALFLILSNTLLYFRARALSSKKYSLLFIILLLVSILLASSLTTFYI
tara:strand:+ start:1429 stop:1761 length:333 start_codon:yes stop_codon:yes gene_type:complete